MDEELRILNRIDLPAALAALDDRILGALAIRRREAVATRRLMALAAFVSLGGGIFAGSGISQPAVAASPLTPFGPPRALAIGRATRWERVCQSVFVSVLAVSLQNKTHIVTIS